MRGLFRTRSAGRSSRNSGRGVSGSRIRSTQRGSWRPRLESLEPRCLLAADLVSDSFSVHQNADPQSIDVLANDLFSPDYDGRREITAVSLGSQGGSVAIATDGKSLTYAPPADFAGTESITYLVDNVSSTTVQILIEAPLRDDHYVVLPDRQTQTLDLLQNDPFWEGYVGDKQINFVSETSLGGELHIAADGNSVTYQPPDFSHGRDSFVYIVDGKYPARVQIEIPNPIESDRYEVLQNSGATRWDVLANDPFWPSYEGAKEITYFEVTSEEGPTVTSDGTALFFSPEAESSGYASLRYVVDGQFEGTVSVYVRRPVVNDTFEVDQESTGIVIDVLANDHYTDIFRIHRDVVDVVTDVGTTTEGGTVTILPGGQQLRYVPPEGFAGQDTFEYVANGVYRATVRMQVTRPVRDDYFGRESVFQDTPNARLNVLENDFLGEGYAGDRQITGLSESQQGGTLTISDDGGAIFYSPQTGYTGPDSFSYTVDGHLTAQVTLQVTPLAQSDHFSECLVTSDPTYNLPALNNDYFGRGYSGPGEITEVRDVPEGDEVQILSGGRGLQFRPARDGSHQFTYVVDGLYEASLTVWVDGHTIGDSFVVDQNSDPALQDTLVNDLVVRDWDECSALDYHGEWRITEVSNSTEGGTVAISGDGKQVSYAPPADYVGADQYTYTVDGIMQATVNVQVVRRVRDDIFHVVPGQQDRLLTVLANDLFGADYDGPRVITDVSLSQIGATVDIAPSGNGILYGAPTDFVGTDTLTYTVDGRLKAEVTIELREDQAPSQPKFESLETYAQFLIDDALVRYDHLFGQSDHRYYFDDAVTFSQGSAEANLRDHSETNVQVEGIDEADLIEVDADHLYVLRGDELLIAQAWPAEDLSLLSRTDIIGTPIGQYLHGDRLTVVSEVRTITDYPGAMDPWFDGPRFDGGAPINGDSLVVADAPLFGNWWYQPPAMEVTTVVSVLDVSDRTAPQWVQRTEVDGRYVQSRAIDDFVYVVVDGQAVAPKPEIVPDGDDGDETGSDAKILPGGTYETREQYLDRLTENIGQLVQDTLPHYASYGSDGQLVRSGLLSQPEDIFQPFTADAANLLSVLSIDMGADEPGLSSNVGMYVDGADKVYGSHSALYVFANDYVPEDGAITRIYQFTWDRQTGALAYQATGQVPGTMINQFSADEYDGYLRIATSVRHDHSGNWTSREENDLFVLQSSGGVLQTVGSLTNLALDESIRSVRFFGTQAYVVTYRTIDPLFVIELAQPTQPTVVGHVTLPGFSSYLQVIASDRILGVGRNTATGNSGPTQVSLFDTGDPAHPQLLDQYTFARFSTSIAEDDHHAVGYFGAHQILALPSQRQFVRRTDEDGDGYPETRNWVTEEDLVLLHIDPTVPDPEIIELAAIGHSARVLRSGYIGDKLYSIGEDAIKVVDVDAPGTLVAELLIAPPDEGPSDTDPVEPVPLESLMHAWSEPARQDLAARLGISDGAPLVVAAESTTGESITGESITDRDAAVGQIVLRVGSQEYLYRASEEQSAELVDDDYRFVRENVFPGWHNLSRPEDINGDAEVSPTDVLAVVREIDAYGGGRRLPAAGVVRQIGSPLAGEDLTTPRFLDVNRDGYVSPTDALRVIRTLESQQEVRDIPGVAAVPVSAVLLSSTTDETLASTVHRSSVDAALVDSIVTERQEIPAKYRLDQLLEFDESSKILAQPVSVTSSLGGWSAREVDLAFAEEDRAHDVDEERGPVLESL